MFTTTVDTASYTLPAGTFTDTAVLTHTVVSPLHAPASSGGLQMTNHVYQVTATFQDSGGEAQPAGAYTVTVEYSDEEIAATGLASDDMLALYYYDDGSGRWVREPTSSVDTAANTVTASPDHFSLWALMSEPRRLFLPLVLRGG